MRLNPPRGSHNLSTISDALAGTMLSILVTLAAAFVMPRVGTAHERVPARMRAISMGLELSQPSQAESESMGLRDWPSTVVASRYTDVCDDGALRYVLEGSGTASLDGSESLAVGVGSLVTVRGGGEVVWCTDGDEMVLLTPEYKGPPLLPIAGGLFLAFGVLIAASFSG